MDLNIVLEGDQVSLAIIWPANPRAVTLQEEANPELHREILREQDAVYWDSMPKRKELRGPLHGYIYLDGVVRYRCRVEHVIGRETLLNRRNEHQYVPIFRQQCLLGHWPDSQVHTVSDTWIKISQIEPLDPPLEIKSIRKINGQPLRAVVGGLVYIQDPMP